MNRARLSPAEALAMLAWISWSEQQCTENPLAFLRGYLVARGQDPVDPRPDARREPEPERHDTEPSLATPVGRVPLVKRPR